MTHSPSPQRTTSIVFRLLAAFLLVSLLPIGSLAYLSYQETRAAAEPAAAAEDEAHDEAEAGAGEAAGHAEGESLFGLPLATVELLVAVFSLGLGVVMALYIGRTLIRPLRTLEAAMSRAEGGDLEAFVPVTSSDELGRVAGAYNQMLRGLQREALIRDLFGQYVTPEVARVAIEQRGHLDGQLVNCSVLFADIRGFTPLTETLPPAVLIMLLNRYFAAMSTVVVEEGGLVNRFGGDSLLAIFGTPLNPNPAHARRAVRAALRMQAALGHFNQEQAAQQMPEIRIGIGVATGDIVAGNIGSSKKVEYTVIGDAVNVAARLQALTKEYGKEIMLSTETAEAVREQVKLRAICQVEIRGKSAPVDVYAVEGPGALLAPT